MGTSPVLSSSSSLRRIDAPAQNIMSPKNSIKVITQMTKIHSSCVQTPMSSQGTIFSPTGGIAPEDFGSSTLSNPQVIHSLLVPTNTENYVQIQERNPESALISQESEIFRQNSWEIK